MIHPLLSGGLLLLLTTGIRASTYISLGGNFQQLPSGIIGECRSVYNQPIENCSAKDFQLNGACSQECVASLENLSNVLNTVCPGVIVDSRTLLGLIFQNLLVKAVCNAIESPVQSEEPTVAATTPVNTLEAATTSAEPTQSPTSEASPSIASTEEPAKSSALGLGPNPTPEPTPTEVEVPQTTSSSKQEEPTSRSKKQEQIDANRNSGGGSPFDNIIPDNEAVHTSRSPIMSLVAALLATIILV